MVIRSATTTPVAAMMYNNQSETWMKTLKALKKKVNPPKAKTEES